MLSIINRQFLQELRDSAEGMVSRNPNPDWRRAYQQLADAADRLDAMEARSQLSPPEGGKEGPPSNKPS